MKVKKANEQRIEIINNGGVIIMPTDTVYGLVCSALNPGSVKRMYEIKRRAGKPGTIIAASLGQLENMGFDSKELKAASKFWPDSVSVVLSAPGSLKYLHMGRGSLAVRIPKPEWLRELLEQTGPLATTSANYPDEPTVTYIEEAKTVFGEKVDLYVDGGEIKNRRPSSIIKIREDGSIEKLR